MPEPGSTTTQRAAKDLLGAMSLLVSEALGVLPGRDRKSTRLNSSHEWISYAVFCLKKKKNHKKNSTQPKPPPVRDPQQRRPATTDCGHEGITAQETKTRRPFPSDIQRPPLGRELSA